MRLYRAIRGFSGLVQQHLGSIDGSSDADVKLSDEEHAALRRLSLQRTAHVMITVGTSEMLRYRSLDFIARLTGIAEP